MFVFRKFPETEVTAVLGTASNKACLSYLFGSAGRDLTARERDEGWAGARLRYFGGWLALAVSLGKGFLSMLVGQLDIQALFQIFSDLKNPR